MEAYLNELSLPNCVSDDIAREVFQKFGDYYQRARIAGIREIKISDNFYTYLLAPGYTFNHWLGDNRADEDLKTLLKNVLGTLPYINQIFEDYQREYDRPLTILYNGSNCIGLGLSSDKIFNSIAFSFESNEWNLSTYPVQITSIQEANNGELEEYTESATARNISNVPHTEVHRQFINSNVINTVLSGRELWEKREDLFPNLIFCESVRSQIISIPANSISFAQIIGRLFDLQNSAIRFDNTPPKPIDFLTKTTPESNGRIQDFGNRLTILCPDKQNRLFSWHARYTPGAGRIHIFPIKSERRIVVGYIGQKIQ